jgi:hypothetical protein
MYPSGIVVDPNGEIVDLNSVKWKNDGSILFKNGLIVYKDGSALFPNGIKLDCDGFSVSPSLPVKNVHCVANAKNPDSPDASYDGTLRYDNGVIVYPDGSIKFPNDTVYYPSG